MVCACARGAGAQRASRSVCNAADPTAREKQLAADEAAKAAAAAEPVTPPDAAAASG